jgi:hypothetical protein
MATVPSRVIEPLHKEIREYLAPKSLALGEHPNKVLLEATTGTI